MWRTLRRSARDELRSLLAHVRLLLVLGHGSWGTVLFDVSVGAWGTVLFGVSVGAWVGHSSVWC